MSIKRRKLIKEERQYLLNKYNQKCAYCGCDLNYESLTADHIIPLHKNGTDQPAGVAITTKAHTQPNNSVNK